MPTFPALPGLVRAPAWTLLISAAVALGACGGGGGDDDPPDGGSGGTAPSASIDALAGDWVQKGCVRTGAQSFRKTLRARITGRTTLEYYEGVLTFNGSGCTGASWQAGPSKLGAVTFARSEGNQKLAAHWGEFRTVIGTRFGAIWALRSSSQLCLLGDDMPTSLPTLSSVSAGLATVPADNCFVR
jgi:hypothetical protein